MTPLTPEQLIEKMATAMPNTIPFGKCKAISDELLRIVLQAIEDGEVVEAKYSSFCDEVDFEGVGLKPDFANFLRGEK